MIHGPLTDRSGLTRQATVPAAVSGPQRPPIPRVGPDEPPDHRFHRWRGARPTPRSTLTRDDLDGSDRAAALVPMAHADRLSVGRYREGIHGRDLLLMAPDRTLS